MANDLTTFYNTVAAKFNELNQHLQPHLGFLSAVYKNPIDPEPKEPNQTVRINLVDVDGNVVNAISTAPGINNINTTSTNVVLDNMATKPFSLTQMEATQAADSEGLIGQAVEKVFIQMAEYINKAIADKYLVATFNVAGNPAATSIALNNPATVQYSEFISARKTLSARKIPLGDRKNLFVIAHPEIYNNWFIDDKFGKVEWNGDKRVNDLRENGTIAPSHGFTFIEDSQTSAVGSNPIVYSTAVFHAHSCVLAPAAMKPPMGNVEYRYAKVFGLPVLLTFAYDENLSGTGGPKNIVIPRILFTVKEHRKDHAVIIRTSVATA